MFREQHTAWIGQDEACRVETEKAAKTAQQEICIALNENVHIF